MFTCTYVAYLYVTNYYWCFNGFGWVGTGKSREGFCEVWLFDGDEEVLALNQDRLSGSSSGDGDHWLSRDTICVAKMDYWRGTPGLRRQVPRIWLHWSSQLFSCLGPVSLQTPWDLAISTFFPAASLLNYAMIAQSIHPESWLNKSCPQMRLKKYFFNRLRAMSSLTTNVQFALIRY